jgi:NADH-quinone oxidoreductase subunit N
MPPFDAPPIDYRVISQPLILSVAALVVLLTDLFLPDLDNTLNVRNAVDRLGAALIPNEKDWLAWLSLAGIIGATILGVRLWPEVMGQQGSSISAFQGTVTLDFFSLASSLILLVVAACVVLMTPRYLAFRRMARGEFYALLLFATAGGMLMASGTDLIVIFLGLEVLSIPLYILSSFFRPRLESEESGIKYFLLGAFASGFLLYGIALVYGAMGTTNLLAINQRLLEAFQTGNDPSKNPMLLAGVMLLLVGFGFKIAMAPFHQWTPDVYEGAPTPVTAFMVTGTKAAGFAALIRVLLQGFPVLAQTWIPVIAALAVITMTLGNLGALRQNNIKRMLAYSSIAHAGYLLVALLARNPVAALIYLAVYALMNLGVFAVIIALGQQGRERLLIGEYAGLGRQHPFLAGAMTIFLLSLAGFPPLAGFFAKLMVFIAGVQADLTWLVIVAVLNSVVSVFYYVQIVIQMYMHDADELLPAVSVTPLLAASLIIALIGVIALGLYPTPLINVF